MKLTPEQVEVVRKWLSLDRTADACCNKDRDGPHYDNSGCEFLACEDCPPRVAAIRVFDAYHRVEALADNYDTMTVLDQSEHRRNMQIAASIRRALYGE